MESLKKLNSTSIVIQADEKFWKRMDIFFLFVIILLLTWAGQGQGQEYKKCDADEYQCFNGECIDADYFCDFTPDCADNSDETFCFLECISSDDLRGDFYQGKRNITWSGRPCQRYDQQSPHEHNFGYLASHSDNYCRNDDDSPVPWCYTLDPKVRWEICNIPRCKEYELGSCSFETDMCGWKQPRNSIPWNRQIDWMDSSEEETILVLDTSMETPTNHSLLISPTIRPSLDVTCLGISFYTYGSGVQNIYIHVSYGMDELKLASEAKRIKKSMWHQTYISLSERTKFGIVIKAEISDLDAGGIAIGDLSLDLGICEGLDLCTTSQYQCDDWTCIDVHKFCDGIANCPDSSDEANCHIHCLPDYDKHGLKYNGQLNVTKSGRICQRWNSIVPHNHSYHKLRENYCRNPNEKTRPWCFTTDPNLRWEYCDVPKCDGECLQKDDTEGTSYDGRLNMTSSGRQCQRWDTQTPHEHEELFHDEENYCRNNGDAVNIWCLTMDPEVNWEFCTLPTCEPSRCRPDDHSCQERLRMQKATRSVELGVIVDNDACWDGIMCRDSNICVPKEKICDGIYQCPLYDDEMSCNMSCPVHCTCMGLILDCSFTCSIVANLPVEVRTLNISGAMFTLSMLFVDKLPFLIHLNITKTNLLAINDDDIFANKLQCDNLQTLYLTHNEITTISRYAFARLFRLRELHLDGNPILILQHDMFNQLHNLIYLSVTETQIRNLSKGTFDGLLQLKKINLDSNKIEIIESESLHSLKEISNIYLDHNNLTVLDNFFSLKMTELVVLDMSHNQIQNITSSSLEGLYYLEHLDLSNNKLEIIPENAFIFLQALLRLNISFNNIKVIETSAFEGLVSVRSLDLQGNKLEYIAAGVFRGLKTVTFINLNSNLLHHIEHRTFMDVSELSVLYLQNNKLTVYEEMFYGLCKLVTIHADTYRICCARPPSVLPQNCVAPTYTISSCNHLIDVGLLSVAIWLIAIFTLGGNAFVTIYRCTTIKKRKSNPHIVFILNLSISDFVMGIYLMIIAVADLQFRGDYGYKDLEWRNSATCTISGVLATVSSETSAILLFVITIDRLIALKFPFSKFKFTFRISVTISIIVWILSGILAILPLLLFDSYYAESSVCVSLPLSTYQDVGREYSMGLFIFFNLSLFLGIVAGQLVIYLEVRRVEKNVKKERSMEIAVARTLITLALTDALCWIPIAILGILTQNGIGISSTVYAWVVVLVLPINSALNPFLYTFSEVRAERRRLQMKSEIHGKLSHSADQT